jgi:hypothetical protein
MRRLPLILLLLLVAVAVPAAEASAMRLGVADGVFAAPAGERDPWLARTAAAGADVVRVPSSWSGLAPTRPADEADPADPAYRWAGLDDAVKAARAQGLDVLLGLTAAPAWAEGPARPSGTVAGAWKPDPAAYGRFARALALRYSGRHPDPAAPGRALPRVRHFSPWNEPNLDKYLAPQWERRGATWRTFAPGHYRRLVNAFAAGVKGVHRDNRVVAGATGPFGDPQPGGSRIMPVRFVREWLSRRTTFDVLAHHPYSVRGPWAPALNADDVSVADMGKLRRVLRAAEGAGRLAPRGRRALWVTEVSWDSSPPDPLGVPARRHAEWLADALLALSRSGVSTVLWYLARDDAPVPSYGATVQSGLFLRDGTPKLAREAFAFPLAVRRSGSAVTLWTRAPAAGRLVLERRAGAGWRTVHAATVRRRGVVTRRVRLPRGAVVRARVGDRASLTRSAR